MTTLEKTLLYSGVALIMGSVLASILDYYDPKSSFFILMLGTALQFNGQNRYNRRLRQRIEELEAQPRR